MHDNSKQKTKRTNWHDSLESCMDNSLSLMSLILECHSRVRSFTYITLVGLRMDFNFSEIFAIERHELTQS